jgi:GDPmannose 4,6-dehydratase
MGSPCKVGLIFGVTGQDGSYLAELLLSKGYKVVGVSRRVSVASDERIAHLYSNPLFERVEGDVTDAMSVYRIIAKYDPFSLAFPSVIDARRYEIYNLAAQSHVGTSFSLPNHTCESTFLGCLNILEGIRNNIHGCDFRFYQASTSEMFGTAHSWRGAGDGEEFHCHGRACNAHDTNGGSYQSERTPMLPCSPYAVAKLAAHQMVKVYRESYRMHASAGILFNHESRRRGDQFVTRKITKHIGSLMRARKAGQAHPKLLLGNIDAYRDWGHAEDYVYAMWQMLQMHKPDDYVIATGQTRTVRQFLLQAFQHVGIILGNEMDKYVEIHEDCLRPNEVPYLRGDPSKAFEKFGWKPLITFEKLVQDMVDSDVKRAA